jgi:hypothetical protein
MDRHHIKAYLPRARLIEIDMPPPAIIGAYTYSQNPVFTSGTPEEIVEKYRRAQSIGLEAIRWICEAKVKCQTMPNGWHWESGPSELFTALQFGPPQITNIAEQGLVEYFNDASDEEVDNCKRSQHSSTYDGSLTHPPALALVKYVPKPSANSDASNNSGPQTSVKSKNRSDLFSDDRPTVSELLEQLRL